MDTFERLNLKDQKEIKNKVLKLEIESFCIKNKKNWIPRKTSK